MTKIITKIISVCCILWITAACEKDNISNSYIDQNKDRMDKIAENFKRTIASSETGWVMMVKSNLTSDIYAPVILKFDTAKNEVKITTVYGITNNTTDYFRIANGTGSPQLIFTTGSIMSTLYRVGAAASDITDHIYNVVSVKDDEIQIQPYRSGNVYSKEGGVVYKLFKRPTEWTWADDKIEFDFTSDAFTNNINAVTGEMKFDYLNSNTSKTFEWRFWRWSANGEFFRIRDLFDVQYNIGAGGFKPANYLIVTGKITNNVNTTAMVGHNAISLFPFPYNNGTDQEVKKLINQINTHYLIFKNRTNVGENVKMEFVAYGKDGQEVLKAFYDNKR